MLRADSRPATSPRASQRHRELPLNDDNTPASPDRAVTILTLAIELNTSTHTLLDLARMMHLPVGGDEEPLSDEDAERLRTLYTLTGGQMPTHQSVEITVGVVIMTGDLLGVR